MITENENFKIINERFPHIGKKLAFFWGDKECVDYLQSLLIPNRVGRKGFPFEVVVAINYLCDLHDNEYPKHKKISKDIWE